MSEKTDPASRPHQLTAWVDSCRPQAQEVEMMKLYIVVRSSLEAGLCAAQAVHAAVLFGETFPHIKDYWYNESNNVVVLQHDDIDELTARLEAAGFRMAKFHEPDMDDQLTAICVEPGAWRMLSSLKLAGRTRDRAAA